MKKLLKIILALAGLYCLLLIPFPEAEDELQLAAESPFVWDQDALWEQLEETFVRGRNMDSADLDTLVTQMTLELDSIVNNHSHETMAPKDPFYPLVLDRFFRVAPLIAAQQHKSDWYIGFYNRLRKKLKSDSQNWDMGQAAARQQAYRVLYGVRAGVEEIMLQSTPEEFNATQYVSKEPSVTPSANILGIEVHSGDLLVSRGGAEVSAFISRGNDYPGNFSHVALVYIDADSGEPAFVEAHIEKGVAIASKEQYLKDKKLRFMVMRPRANLEALRANPMLPHQAAAYMYEESRSRHIPYDFKMDYFDPSAMFCSEVGSFAYKQFGMPLWEYPSTISSDGIINWLHSFGVEHFVTQMPSDLEYDPMLSVVAEWRDQQTLFKDHLDNAVMDALIERANSGEQIDYNIWLLPVARVLKAYSFLQTTFGKEGIIPEGMSAVTALKNNDFVSRFQQLKEQTALRAAAFEREQGYVPPYWQLVRFAEKG
ncbi:YiiX/YebB-like N1pC/P60 family cysteine hydrolase [Robiginitalea sp. IMCC44478]|uniref:YiiX/YebB-like N1pC/P60 family cysteine hydrolase n=1 Tax=Robiginitalea sp. IMCC44478 TaxID=3459122 RepID=UPI0040423C4E